jgi:uncharacterized protein YqeY
MTIEQLNKEMVAAMKNKDKPRKDTISALIGAIKKVAIDKGCRDNIPEELITEVILKEQKTVNEMIDTCPTDRVETLAEYKARAAVIAEFAPKMMTEDEIAAELGAYCTSEGLELTKANRAAIMRGFMPTIKGRADGKLANKVITEKLI